MEYAEDLATGLELERLDRDLFRGINTVMAKERSSLFGGQVCAQALMAAGLGEKEMAIEWLERVRDARSGWVPFLPVEPEFATLRDEPRFSALQSDVKR